MVAEEPEQPRRQPERRFLAPNVPSGVEGWWRSDALLAPFGGAEAVYAAAAALRENRKYLDEHRAELKRLYPEEWIVIARGRVVTHAGTPDEAARMARERGESMAAAFVRHIPTEERAWLLRTRRFPC